MMYVKDMKKTVGIFPLAYINDTYWYLIAFHPELSFWENIKLNCFGRITDEKKPELSCN